MENEQTARGVVLVANGHDNRYTVSVTGKGYIPDLRYIGDGSSLVNGPQSRKTILPGAIVDVDTSAGDSRAYFIKREVPLFRQSTGITVQTPSIIPAALSDDASVDPNVDRYYETLHKDRNLYAGYSAGSYNYMGVGYGHSLEHAYLRGSDICGIDAFSRDNLLRVKAYNLEKFTSMGEEHIQADGNTATKTSQTSWLINETLGKNTDLEPFYVSSMRDTLSTEETIDDLEEVLLNEDRSFVNNPDPILMNRLEKLYQKYEQIQSDHPQILPRNISMEGYLPNGKLDQIVKSGSAKLRLPGDRTDDAFLATGILGEAAKEVVKTHAVQKNPIVTGLSEVQQTADGRIRVASAKSVSLVKEINIPVPTQVREVPTTDVDSFKVPPVVDPVVLSPQQASRSAEYTEGINRKNDRRFIDAHPAWDYGVTEGQQTSGSVIEKVLGGVDYKPLTLTQHEYPMPPSVDVQVDPDTNVKYFKSKAGFFILDDGSILIKDGYGSTITMTGGNIYTQCPGDVWTVPGRDVNVLAGRNLSLRAQQDLEAVSVSGNLRLKADKQLSIVGGAGQATGGVLVQNQAKAAPLLGPGKTMSTGGIVLKSESHISIAALKGVGVNSDIAVRGVEGPAQVSVEGMVSTTNLDVEILAQATTTQIGAGGSSPVIIPVATHTAVIDAAYGFTAPASEFSFNSSLEYGYPPNYGLTLMEAHWQTRDRNTGVTAAPWMEKAIVPVAPNFSMPSPGFEQMSLPIFCQPTSTESHNLEPTLVDVTGYVKTPFITPGAASNEYVTGLRVTV